MAFIPERQAVISTVNSTTTNLVANGTFTGGWEDITVYSSTVTTVATDQDSAIDGLSLQFGSVAALERSKDTDVLANVSSVHTLAGVNKFFRVVYTNGPIAQTSFSIQTKFSIAQQAGLITQIDEIITTENDAQLVKAVIVGANDDDTQYTNVRVNQQGMLSTRIDSPLTAFGDLSTAEQSPILQVRWPYGSTPSTQEGISAQNNAGTVTIADDLISVSSGASADSSALYLTNRVLRYNPGQGSLCRFTGLFTDGVAGNEQIIGVGSPSDGLFFGYDGPDFGILRRKGGVLETRRLTITTPSTTAENITITLDGDADATVAVTNNGDVNITAREISDHNFENLGDGWQAAAKGDEVIFTSRRPEPRTGTYSLTSATTAVGSFVQDIAGVDSIDQWTPQADWSDDKMDGSGFSEMVLVKTNLNIFEIQFQWLDAEFLIEDSSTGKVIVVHRINFANNNTTVSLNNPTLPVYLDSINTTNTSNITLKSASLNGSIMGRNVKFGPKFSTANLITQSGTAELPLLTLRSKNTRNGRNNRTRLQLVNVNLVSNLANANANTTFRIYVGERPLVNTSYFDVNAESAAEVDISATTSTVSASSVARGIFQLAAVETRTINVFDLADDFGPGITVLITQQPSKSNAGNEVGATLTWQELY